MTQKHARADLSELEGCVLGVVSRLGPCTAYRVRKEFSSSFTTSWRASAGAIYPLLERLAQRDLIEERAVSDDRRGTRKISLSVYGKRALSEWIGTPTTWLAEPAADPVRSRLQFLDQSQHDRQAVIEAWIAETERGLEQLERERREQPDPVNPFNDAALRGSWYQLEARKKWLKEILRTLS